MADKNVIVIAGPTAVGKTEVAIELVSKIGGEIVSADSMAVYRGMDIGTAKPTALEQAKAKFHLIDVADPNEWFSVGDFQRLAWQAIDDILKRNPPAIIVGGSGLYIRAAVDGLDESIPSGNDEIRKKLEIEAKTYGRVCLHQRLAEIDPLSAQKIHPSNLKRVIRAIEIFELTGRPASELFAESQRKAPRYPGAAFFGLRMERNALYKRIEGRIDKMIEAGLVDEVRHLMENGVDLNKPSMQGLGYKEIAGYLQGEYSIEIAIDLLKKNTRRFAKRQYTWFNADKRIKWIDVDGKTASEVSTIIQGELIL